MYFSDQWQNANERACEECREKNIKVFGGGGESPGWGSGRGSLRNSVATAHAWWGCEALLPRERREFIGSHEAQAGQRAMWPPPNSRPGVSVVRVFSPGGGCRKNG